MQPRLIALNPDLRRLWDDGLELEIRYNYLLVHNVPYVDSARQVKRGTLISELTLAGDRTVRPGTHVAEFIGDHPCNVDGSLIAQIQNSSGSKNLGPDLVVNHTFSSKPANGYADYHEKITTYIAIISSPAFALDRSVTAYTKQIAEHRRDESPFCFEDTNSARAGINMVSVKLENQIIAIIGLGGTGSYVLDFVSKTPVKQILLFDGDEFLSHNAFRAPGAAAVEVLRERTKKVDYLKGIYSKMHRNIVANPVNIDGFNVDLLSGASFAFVCVDDGPAKKPIVDGLLTLGVPFVDVGMGLELVAEQNSLVGHIRATLVTPQKRDHVDRRIGFSPDPNGVYASNIQIAELNAFNASLAVIKWKKVCGYYPNMAKEYNTVFAVGTGEMFNDEIGA
jgi:hypothetical protein